MSQYLSTIEENKGLAKKEKMKMSPFYVEGDRKANPGNFEIFTLSSIAGGSGR
jgi:hypothetical protein